MLNRMKVGTKLIGGFTLVALIGVAIGAVGFTSLRSMSASNDEIGGNQLPAVQNLLEMNGAQKAVWIGERGLLNPRMMEPSVRTAQYKYIDAAWDQAEAASKTYQTLTRTPDQERLWGEVAPRWQEWKNAHNQVRSLSEEKDRVLAAGVALDDPRIIDLDQRAFDASMQARTLYLAAENKLKELIASTIADSKVDVQAANALSSRSQTIMVFAILIGLGVSLVLGLVLARSITRPVAATVRMIQEMGKGHLGGRLHLQREDELGILAHTMDQFAEDLQTVVVAGMRQIADGNLQVEVPVKDGQDEIGPALKQTVESLRGLVSEVNGLSQAAVEGRLATRGQADRFQGGYRQIVEGINATMEAVVVPINEAATVMGKVAAKDLTARMAGQYQGDFTRIKESINTAVNNLDDGLGQVGVSSEQVSSAAGQISSGSQSLAEGASEQASSLEEISSSLEEMASMTKQNADNSDQAKGLAQTARGSAEKGLAAMERMTGAIDKIKTSSDQTAKIVKTIDEIAFQTNLLALNAAVEAARAGEAGKGFAVVAEEVRNLAQRSAEAAKTTADMIEESVKNAEDGVKVTEEVAATLGEITEGSRKVNELVAEIAAASKEQSQGIEQVNTAVAQLDKVTQQNAANAEESASAAEELNGQSEEMRALLAAYTLTNRARAAAPPPVHHAAHAAAPAAPAPARPARKARPRGAIATAVATATGGNGHHLDPAAVIPLEDDEELKSF